MPARRNPGARVVRSVVSGEDPYPILVDLDAEGMRDLLGDPLVAETRIALLHVDDGRDELRGRTFGTGFAAMVPVHLRAAHPTDGLSAGQSILMRVAPIPSMRRAVSLPRAPWAIAAPVSSSSRTAEGRRASVARRGARVPRHTAAPRFFTRCAAVLLCVDRHHSTTAQLALKASHQRVWEVQLGNDLSLTCYSRRLFCVIARPLNRPL